MDQIGRVLARSSTIRTYSMLMLYLESASCALSQGCGRGRLCLSGTRSSNPRVHVSELGPRMQVLFSPPPPCLLAKATRHQTVSGDLKDRLQTPRRGFFFWHQSCNWVGWRITNGLVLSQKFQTRPNTGTESCNTCDLSLKTMRPSKGSFPQLL